MRFNLERYYQRKKKNVRFQVPLNKRETRFHRQITQVWISSFLPEPMSTGRVAISKRRSVYCMYHCTCLVHSFHQRHMQFIGKEKKNKVARRKCLLLSSRVFYSFQKMKAGIFSYMFLFLQESQQYVIFLLVLTQQSFSKSLPEMDWFSYLLFPCFKLRMSTSL